MGTSRCDNRYSLRNISFYADAFPVIAQDLAEIGINAGVWWIISVHVSYRETWRNIYFSSIKNTSHFAGEAEKVFRLLYFDLTVSAMFGREKSYLTRGFFHILFEFEIFFHFKEAQANRVGNAKGQMTILQNGITFKKSNEYIV